MSAYFDVLVAVESLLRADSRLRDVRIAVRKRPSLEPLQDRFPQLVISPREDLSEVVVKMSSETWDLGYEVYLGLFIDARWDLDTLARRLDIREWIRETFKRPKSLHGLLKGIWDNKYNPRPALGFGMDTPAPNVDYSWQSFAFTEDRPKGFTTD